MTRYCKGNRGLLKPGCGQELENRPEQHDQPRDDAQGAREVIDRLRPGERFLKRDDNGNQQHHGEIHCPQCQQDQHRARAADCARSALPETV
jgi:hypothetical protein